MRILIALDAKLSNLPNELNGFFMKTIRKKPSDRYRNISEILNELIPLAEKLNIKAKPSLGKQNKMKSMFLMYPAKYQIEFDRFIEEFSRKVDETGGVLRITQLEDFLTH